MIRRLSKTVLTLVAIGLFMSSANVAQAQQAFGQNWGTAASGRDWNRFYHYPYVYYPQNFRSKEYYRSTNSLYHRYPAEMRIPVYNKKWHNYYPTSRPYHRGHQFILDVF